MKQHGTLFKAFLVAQIRADRKTKTRRLMNPQPPDWCTEFGFTAFTPSGHISGRGTYKDQGPAEKFFKIPYQVGDQLYIKEEHYLFGHWLRNGTTKTGKQKWRFVCEERRGVMFPDSPPVKVCTSRLQTGWFKRSPLFMPRWAAREWLEVTGVKVERACDISEEDAIAEGVEGKIADRQNFGCRAEGMYLYRDYSAPRFCRGWETAKPSFQSLWYVINGESTWTHWVFVYDFKRIKKP